VFSVLDENTIRIHPPEGEYNKTVFLGWGEPKKTAEGKKWK